ncbi:Lipopolysaccharide assembly protein A [Oligella ureolytica]
MKYLVWIIRIIIFILVLLFAINNTHLIDVNFFADLQAKSVPLVLVLLIAFILGSLFAYFLMAPSYFRGKYKQAKLKDEIASLHKRIPTSAKKYNKNIILKMVVAMVLIFLFPCNQSNKI